MINSFKQLNRYRNFLIKKIKNNFKTNQLNKRKLKNTVFDADNYHSILIVMCDFGIGDAIVASFLINQLRRNNYQVNVVVDERLNFLFNGFIEVDNAYFFNKKKIKKFCKTEKNIKIDLAIDLYDEGDNSLRRVELISSFNPTHTIGFNQYKFLQYDTSIDFNEVNAHITKRSCMILDLLKISYNCVQYHLNIYHDELLTAKKFIDEVCNGSDKFIIVFNPFGSSEAKSFSHEQITKINAFLSQQKNCTTIIVGEQKQICGIDELPNIHLNRNPSFIVASALVSLCHLVISVDTSIVHVASTYNKPMIAVYNNRYNAGFNLNKVWAPIGTNTKLLFTQENKITKEGDRIGELNIQLIIEQIKETLNNFRPLV